MKRILFEFEDLSWFPAVIRDGGTDYLRYLLTAGNIYKPVTAFIIEGLEKTKAEQLIDLCSGGGGAIAQVQQNIKEQNGQDVRIILTDKFPNKNTFEFLRQRSHGKINYTGDNIDATNVPLSLKGFRTIFSGIHHFDKHTVKLVIKDAVDAKEGIGIFDGGDKNILVIIGIILLHPVAMLLFTPFFKPFRWSRLLFTYIIPLIPLYTIWDGVVSIIRLYRPAELLQLAKEVDDSNYIWKAGKVKNKLGINVAYLVGYPH